MPGLSFDAVTRILSGTPTANGATLLTYTATEVPTEVTEDEPLFAEQVFSVIVRDAGQNQRPQVTDIGLMSGLPNTSLTIDLSAYFTDPEGDPLVYTAVSEHPTQVRVVRQEGSVLTLYLGFSLHNAGESTDVMVTATDVFDASARQSVRTRIDQAPVLVRQFIDVELDVDGGPKTYQEETGNSLRSHFSDDNDVSGTSQAEFRFSASLEDETVASVSLGDTGLIPNTSLTLTPAGCVGETEVSVQITDVGGRSSGEGRFTVRVSDPNGEASPCSGGVLANVNRAVLPEVARAIAGHIVDGITRRLDQIRKGIGAEARIGGQTSIAAALVAHGEAVSNDTRSLEDLLGRSSFTLPLGAGAEGDVSTPSFTIWGSGDYRDLSGESEGIDWEGDLLSIHLGVDTQLRNNVTVGLAVSRSRSDVDYKQTAGEASSEGTHDLTVTNVSPYVGWSTERLDLWGQRQPWQGRGGNQQRHLHSAAIERHRDAHHRCRGERQGAGDRGGQHRAPQGRCPPERDRGGRQRCWNPGG